MRKEGSNSKEKKTFSPKKAESAKVDISVKANSCKCVASASAMVKETSNQEFIERIDISSKKRKTARKEICLGIKQNFQEGICVLWRHPLKGENEFTIDAPWWWCKPHQANTERESSEKLAERFSRKLEIILDDHVRARMRGIPN